MKKERERERRKENNWKREEIRELESGKRERRWRYRLGKERREEKGEKETEETEGKEIEERKKKDERMSKNR
jgi:hypothetical protein